MTIYQTGNLEYDFKNLVDFFQHYNSIENKTLSNEIDEVEIQTVINILKDISGNEDELEQANQKIYELEEEIEESNQKIYDLEEDIEEAYQQIEKFMICKKRYNKRTNKLII